MENTIYGLGAEPEDFKSRLHSRICWRILKKCISRPTVLLLLQVRPTRKYWKLLPKRLKERGAMLNHHLILLSPFWIARQRSFYTDKPNALQSAIRIGTPFINRTHPDFPAMQVLNTVLGGYFGSRLMANIREDKGYTYGIGSGMSSFKQTGAFFIASEVGADVCKAAIAEIEKEVNRLKNEIVPDDELSLVRNYMLGSLLGSLENVFSHADKFKNLYFAGLDYDYYERYTQTVKSITSANLQQLANKYFDFENFYKVIVGKH
jgi:zinc protease